MSLSSTIAAHGLFIALAKNTVYNMAYEHQAFTSSLVFAQVRPPNVWWSADFKTITCDGDILTMDSVREAIQKLIAEAWELYDQITGGRRFATHLPKEFADDINNLTRGYSFLHCAQFTDRPNEFLLYLCSPDSPWNIGTVYNGETMSWNVPDIQQFLALTAKFNKTLSVLCFLCPTISTRVTEFLAGKFANDARRRNLFMLLSEMVDLRGYHKMTNQTGLDVCKPVFYPEPLKDLVLEYLAGGMRTCESLLAKYAYGEEAQMLYSR